MGSSPGNDRGIDSWFHSLPPATPLLLSAGETHAFGLVSTDHLPEGWRDLAPAHTGLTAASSPGFLYPRLSTHNTAGTGMGGLIVSDAWIDLSECGMNYFIAFP